MIIIYNYKQQSVTIMRRIGISAGLIAGFLSGIGAASQVLAGTQTLQPVVVTGTLSDTLLEESPVAVEVIDRETIEASQATTLEDLLADQPGLQLKDAHGQTGKSVMLNGLSEKHVLILVDGVPVNNVNESRVDARSLRLADVERVEVVSANASSLYGSAAMGGVINLITRKAEQPGFEIGLRATQAEAERTRAPTQTDLDGRVVVPVAGGHLATSGSLTDYAGFDRTPDTWEEQIPQGLGWSLSNRWDYKGQRDHRVTTSWTGSELSRPGEHAVSGNPNETTVDEQRLSGHYRLAGEQGELVLAGARGWGQSDQDKLATEGVDLRRSYDLWNASIDGRWATTVGPHDQIWGTRLSTAYLAQEKTELDSEAEAEIEPVDQQSIELYVQDDWFTTDRLELITGLRSHWDEAYGLHWAPNLAARFDPTLKTFVRASVGLGYRVPDLKERYYRFDHAQLHGYRVVGNPDLEPETSLSTQLEWVYEPFSVELFYRDIEKLIDTVETESDEPGVAVYEYTNIDAAEVFGANLRLEGNWRSHSLTAHGQWLRATNLTTGLDLSRRPDYTIGLTHQWAFQWGVPLRIRTRLEHTGPQFFGSDETLPVAAHSLIDLSLASELTPRWTLTAAVKNLTDQVSPTDGAQDPLPVAGRQYSLGVRYKQTF